MRGLILFLFLASFAAIGQEPPKGDTTKVKIDTTEYAMILDDWQLQEFAQIEQSKIEVEKARNEAVSRLDEKANTLFTFLLKSNKIAIEDVIPKGVRLQGDTVFILLKKPHGKEGPPPAKAPTNATDVKKRTPKR